MHWFILALVHGVSLFGAISALYLSWYDDPATTMTIQWHTPPNDQEPLRLEAGNGSETYSGSEHPFPGESLMIHTVTLQGLLPDTEYAFTIGKEGKYFFRTAPMRLTKPLRFVVGGDVYLSSFLFRKMGKAVLNVDPLFVVLGGDLAYATGPLGIFANKPSTQWRLFLEDWTKHMKTPNGRLIPFLVVPGNHDITPKTTDLFFALFAFPEKKLYRTMNFGEYLSLVLLDTGHVSPIAGMQTEWLQKSLRTNGDFPHIFAIYHVGAYPSFYPFEGRWETNIRNNWCPLFDQYDVKACFEHHSHTYKKTFPLKNNEIHGEGTIYFGDGCWGAKPRRTNTAWYLEKRGSKNQVYCLDVSEQTTTVRAIGLEGELLDQTLLQARSKHLFE